MLGKKDNGEEPSTCNGNENTEEDSGKNIEGQDEASRVHYITQATRSRRLTSYGHVAKREPVHVT